MRRNRNKNWKRLLVGAAFFILMQTTGNPLFAAPLEIVFAKPDAIASEIVASMFVLEISEAKKFDAIQDFSSIWLDLDGTGPRFLFVHIEDAIHCGSGGCEVRGLEQTPIGWHEIFRGFGTKWEILDTTTEGHREMRETTPSSATKSNITIYAWEGLAYLLSNYETMENP